MKLLHRIILVFITCVLTAYSVRAYAQEVVITHNEGGDVNKFMNTAAQWRHDGISVKIDGECHSSCTIFINEQFKGNTCITENAVLGFHNPYVTNIETGEIVSDISDAMKLQLAIYKDYFWASYHEDIRSYLTEHGWPDVYEGSDREDVTLMVYDDLKHIIRTCD